MDCFGLIETMRARGPEVEFLEQHMARMARSARFLGLDFSQKGFLEAMWSALASGWPDGNTSIRVVLDPQGFRAEIKPIAFCPGTVRLSVSSLRVLAGDPMTQHKLLSRMRYTLVQREAEAKGFWDGIILNHLGRVAECSRANIIVFNEQGFFTPGLDEGALPGVIRSVLMNRIRLEQKPLELEDLARAQGVFVCNSLVRVALVEEIETLQYHPDLEHMWQLRDQMLQALFE